LNDLASSILSEQLNFTGNALTEVVMHCGVIIGGIVQLVNSDIALLSAIVNAA